MQQSKLYHNLLLYIIITVLLTGCATVQRTASNNHTLSTSEYLALATNASGSQKQAYQLKAAERALQNRNINQARQILNQVPSDNLPPALSYERKLLQANLLITNNIDDSALIILNDLKNNGAQLDLTQKIKLQDLFAKAYKKQGKIIESVVALNQLEPLLNNKDAREKNLQTIWQDLQTLSKNALTTALQQTPAKTLRGWISLALIAKESADEPKNLVQEIEYWRAQYPSHPAQALLPKKIRKSYVLQSASPKHIALLLPLHGPLASSGNAIRNGFFAAYYYAKKNRSNVPIVSIYDTSQGNIINLYQTAVQKGADFVVGPLTKQNLQELVSKTRLAVPTLALNTLPEGHNKIPNLYQFGLSPTDEAIQAAYKAWNDHHSRALVIAPDNDWGKRVNDTFSKQWQALGGTIIAQMKFTDQKSLSVDVRKLLNIDQAYNREKTLKGIIHHKVRYLPRRRQDFDMIFMVANPTIARQVRPLLKFYFAGNIPIYSISEIYQGIPNPQYDHDLNGVLFCDMPWVLTPNFMQPTWLDTIQESIRSTWPTSYQRSPRLYALGVDSYDVISQLNNMIVLPQFGTNAATGTLYLLKNGHLYRQLQWSQIIHGRPKIIQ